MRKTLCIFLSYSINVLLLFCLIACVWYIYRCKFLWKTFKFFSKFVVLFLPLIAFLNIINLYSFTYNCKVWVFKFDIEIKIKITLQHFMVWKYLRSIFQISSEAVLPQAKCDSNFFIGRLWIEWSTLGLRFSGRLSNKNNQNSKKLFHTLNRWFLTFFGSQHPFKAI